MQFPDAMEFCLCLRVTGSLGMMVHLPPVIFGQGESVIGHGPVRTYIVRLMMDCGEWSVRGGYSYLFAACTY